MDDVDIGPIDPLPDNWRQVLADLAKTASYADAVDLQYQFLRAVGVGVSCEEDIAMVTEAVEAEIGPMQPLPPRPRFLYSLLAPDGHTISRLEARTQQRAAEAFARFFGGVIHYDGDRWVLAAGYEIISEPL